MTQKPVRLKGGDDEAVVNAFKDLYQDAHNAVRRVIAFGVFAWQVKLLKLKHGQWGQWLQQNVPEISHRSVNGYMSLTESILKSCGVSLKKANLLGERGEFLLLAENKVPEGAQKLRQKVFDLIEGKSQRQLFAEFKQVEEENGESKIKRGRLKGQGGASKEQRANAREAEENARLLEMELAAGEFIKWIDEVCDANGLAKLQERKPALVKRLDEALRTGSAFTGLLVRK